MLSSAVMRIVWIALLAFLTLLTSGAARAETSKLEAARAAYWKLDYEEARTLAEAVLAVPGLEHAEFVEATKLDALSLAALGKDDAARAAFIALLECQPQYELDPKLGPRFRTPYFDARDYWRAQASFPSIDVAYRSEDRALHAEVRDPRGTVQRVVIGVRSEGDAFTLAEGTSARGARLEITAERVEYYAQARNARDQIVLEVGNPMQPRALVVPPRIVAPPLRDANVIAVAEKRMPVPSDKAPGVLASPWFWVGAGVVVTGLAVGGYFVFRGSSDSGQIVARPELRCGPQAAACF